MEEADALHGHGVPPVRLRRHVPHLRRVAAPGHEPLRPRRLPECRRRRYHGALRALVREVC